MPLKNPGLDDTHPKQVFHTKMRQANTISWYGVGSTTLSEAVDSVLNLLGADRNDLRVCNDWYAVDKDRTFVMGAIQHRSGVAVTLWALNDEGYHRIDRAAMRGVAAVAFAKERGEYQNGPLTPSPVYLEGGQSPDAIEWHDFFDIVNRGEIQSLQEWCALQVAKPVHQSSPARAVDAGLTPQLIERVLEGDPDIVAFERDEQAQAGWTVSVDAGQGYPSSTVHVDYGVDDPYVTCLIPLKSNRLMEAFATLQPYATVGLTMMQGAVYIRSGAFANDVSPRGFSQMVKTIASAHHAYRLAIGEI